MPASRIISSDTSMSQLILIPKQMEAFSIIEATSYLLYMTVLVSNVVSDDLGCRISHVTLIDSS